VLPTVCVCAIEQCIRKPHFDDYPHGVQPHCDCRKTDLLISRLSLRIQCHLVDHIFVHTDKMKEELLRSASNRNFAAKVHAFNEGLKRVQDLKFELIGNLDADISFLPQMAVWRRGNYGGGGNRRQSWMRRFSVPLCLGLGEATRSCPRRRCHRVER
jgi:hypothetical protein